MVGSRGGGRWGGCLRVVAGHGGFSFFLGRLAVAMDEEKVGTELWKELWETVEGRSVLDGQFVVAVRDGF